MGIENREYLRDEYEGGPGGFRWSSTSAVVKLIIITVVVFILQLLLTRTDGGSAITQWLQLTGEDLYSRGQVWRLLTYAFCHNTGDLFHMIFNMLSLYFVGGFLLRMLGNREFVWFYCCSAVFAGICSVVYFAIRQQPADVVGASGAVFAVFGLVVMHYPRQKVQLFGAIEMELRWVLAIFIALPFLMERLSNRPVAHAAHFGGLLFAFLYFRGHMRLSGWWDQFARRAAMKRRNKGKLKIFAPPSVTESSLEAQVDPILEKISREGEASLTARERNILIQASRKLKKDRS